MINLFYSVLNMSITGSYVITAIIIVRFFLKKLPKKYSYALWAVAAFRLCCPVSFESAFSIFSLKPFDMTKAQASGAETLKYINNDFAESTYPQPVTGIPYANTLIYDEITTTAGFIDFKNSFIKIIPYIWLSVLCILLLSALISYIKLKKQLSTAVLTESNIYHTDKIHSPFILGLIKPKIYLPYAIDENTEKYVLTHECYHITRRDYIVKPFAYCILSIHWFNPLCWLAFNLMSRDMEMSCDEKILSESAGIKKAYSTALLSFASGTHFPSGSPLSFSESDAKKRIKNILSYKKPAVWLSVITIMLICIITIGCAANPKAPALIENSVYNNASYTAGRTIFQYPALSTIVKDGSQYADITIDQSNLIIKDSDGNIIFESKSVTSREYTRNTLIEYFEKAAFAEDSIKNEIPADCDNLTECIYKSNSDQCFAVYWHNSIPLYIAEILAENHTIMRLYEILPNTAQLEAAISREILNQHTGRYFNSDYNAVSPCESHYTLMTRMGSIENKNDHTCITAYVYKNYSEFGIDNHLLNETGASAGYAAITFNIDKNGQFSLKEYWEPRDGGLLKKDLGEVFPEGIVDSFEDYYNNSRDIIIQKNYAKAIEMSNFDTDKAIKKLFSDIENNKEIAYSSSPADYINASPDKYNLLINYGDYTLKYIYKAFLSGDNEGMKDNLMWIIMKELTPNEVLKTVCYSGEEYFNLFYEHAIRMYELNGEEYMKENEPKAWLLLEMDYIK